MTRLSLSCCLLGLLALATILPTPAAAGTCNLSLCNAQVTVTQYTGNLRPECEDPGEAIVKVVVTYNCNPDCNGTVTFYRCAGSNEPYEITTCATHRFVGVNGYWGDALVECNVVTFYQ